MLYRKFNKFLLVLLLKIGESDDDHEELLAAANSARNASSMYLAILSLQSYFPLKIQFFFKYFYCSND